jgi:predicted amidohydrolase
MRWQGLHPELLDAVLPEAVGRMLDRLGGAAAGYGMYLACCLDVLEPNGAMRNTAFLLGRDGGEIGRYHKVTLPLQEWDKAPGEGFPVFQTPDLGGVGLLICYDLVFPEPARCLALNGADVFLWLTGGPAAAGSAELSRAVCRTRAAENHVYLVASWGGGNERTGSMIISPQGEILVDERTPGAIAIADVDPFGGREGADFANYQADMRARRFRERRPGAYGVLTDPHPPALDRLPPITPPPQEIPGIFRRATTAGHVAYDRAQALVEEGRVEEAARAFEALQATYPGTWFDRTAGVRLDELRNMSASVEKDS